MYHVDRNNVITINRGDYMKFPITLWTGTFPKQDKVILEEGDVVFFGLMHANEPFERAFIKREYSYNDMNTDGDLELVIYPEDTLELTPGVYYYALKALYQANGETIVDTLVQKTRFIVVD